MLPDRMPFRPGEDALPVELLAANRIAAVELAEARQEQMPGKRMESDGIMRMVFAIVGCPFPTKRIGTR